MLTEVAELNSNSGLRIAFLLTNASRLASYKTNESMKEILKLTLLLEFRTLLSLLKFQDTSSETHKGFEDSSVCGVSCSNVTQTLSDKRTLPCMNHTSKQTLSSQPQNIH